MVSKRGYHFVVCVQGYSFHPQQVCCYPPDDEEKFYSWRVCTATNSSAYGTGTRFDTTRNVTHVVIDRLHYHSKIQIFYPCKNDALSLLGLVTGSVCLFHACWAAAASHVGALAVLSRAYTRKESERIRLLVSVKILHVCIRNHICC